ncbi:uncharacterized protein [Phyllobates terribilis]|uniref:uncharacterized protein n=1 Tax=Phyllobates terribilis TaxID=111132 RepID=UPI003CCB57D0
MVHTRCTNSPLLDFDSEIERTHLRNLRQALENLVVENMAARTLRELTAPNLAQQPLAVVVPPLDVGVSFELKSGVINLLPKFHGLAGEDPIMHLGEFHDICMCSKPANVTEEQFKMRAFGFTLKDTARNWYYHLPAGSIDTSPKLYKAFLDKYFPARKSTALKRAIANVEQADDETLYDYFERFMRLCASCPFHGFDEKELVIHLYNGLLDQERRIIDAACNGSVLNLTPDIAMSRIHDIADGTRSFGRTYSRKGVHAANSSSSDVSNTLAELKSMIETLVLTRTNDPPARACGVCTDETHPMDMCPQLHDTTTADVNVVGGYGPPRPRFDNQGHNYNQRWNDHPGFRYGDPAGTESSIKSIEKQLSQLAEAMNQSNQQHSKSLPSQMVVNLRANVSAINLRSGKVCGDAPIAELGEDEDEAAETFPRARPTCRGRGSSAEVEEEYYEDRGDFRLRQENYVHPNFPPLQAEKPPAPFPEALKDTRRPVNDKELFETFIKCEVNIPLLKLIKSVPRYAKFLKELCTIKRKQQLKGKQKVQVSKGVSAMFQQKVAKKCSDPGMVSIPCTIGETKIDNAMLDLGVSINVLPYSLYNLLGLGPLNETGIVIQLADRSSVYPKGIVEDVLVMVDHLIFPADFFVLDMAQEAKDSLILLGRPFMKTANTRIDLASGSLTFEFDGDVVSYNIYDALKHPSDDNSLFSIDVIDPIVQDRLMYMVWMS